MTLQNPRLNPAWPSYRFSPLPGGCQPVRARTVGELSVANWWGNRPLFTFRERSCDP